MKIQKMVLKGWLTNNTPIAGNIKMPNNDLLIARY